MKMLWLVLLAGLIGLYFINIALIKMPFLDWEWGKHAGIRFLLGFFILGANAFYAQKMRFGQALKVIVVIVFLDYLYDYFIDAYRFNFEIILHGIYMITWGALTGYLAFRNLNNKEEA
ncbi:MULTISPECIES: hypothetical protein [Methylomonas]|uniref:hypothetical protein n=1 Tax=Methylomonas TaxID=416 RepID=UPI00123234B3|nr:hypothetical protein [Methylomonas rhizoryzae]